jgi:hypothetical protein
VLVTTGAGPAVGLVAIALVAAICLLSQGTVATGKSGGHGQASDKPPGLPDNCDLAQASLMFMQVMTELLQITCAECATATPTVGTQNFSGPDLTRAHVGVVPYLPMHRVA